MTLCYEVLFQLMLENFFDWMVTSNLSDALVKSWKTAYTSFQEKYKKGDSAAEDLNRLSEITNNSLFPHFLKFRNEGKSKSATFEFWDNCLLAIQLLLDYISAERESKWEDHIKAFCNMLPYFFVCNKPNYSRWGTLYALEMLHNLPNEVKEDFKKGRFSVKFTPDPLRGIWSDMAVEMSIIKDTKSNSGIIGLTRKEPSILRWTISQNILGTK